MVNQTINISFFENCHYYYYSIATILPNYFHYWILMLYYDQFNDSEDIDINTTRAS